MNSRDRARNQDDPEFPIVEHLTKALKASGALKGKTIIWHCHLTLLTELAAQAVLAAGAKVIFSECNSGTTQIEAVQNLRSMDCPVYTGKDSTSHAIEHQADILADTGYVLIPAYITSAKSGVIGASEITTSGILRLRQQEPPPFAVVNINDGTLKSLIENFHGVGDGLVEALDANIAGGLQSKKITVAGYGRVGAGCAYHLALAGAHVSVVEADPVRALTAHFDGYSLTDLTSALKTSDILVTATGQARLLNQEQYKIARDGIYIANVGHLAAEVSPEALEQLCSSKSSISRGLTSYELDSDDYKKDKSIYLFTDGNPVNVALLTGSDKPTMIHLVTEIFTWDFIAQNGPLASLSPGEMAIPAAVEKAASKVALAALGYQLM